VQRAAACEANSAMATISAALREAISVGAPTYNGGNHSTAAVLLRARRG
jgi:hypothetical protein